MTVDMFKEELRGLGLPVAYLKFPDRQALPFMVYILPSFEVQYADNMPMARRYHGILEVYSADPDWDLQRRVEKLFLELGIPHEKTVETMVNVEDTVVVVYEYELFEICEFE